MEQANITSDGLTTTDAAGNPPASRIANATSARSIITQLSTADAVRAIRRASIKGLIDGNKPYDETELTRLGQGHRSNFNTRQAEGHINARKTSYYELRTSVPTLADILFCDVPPGYEHVYCGYASKITKRFDAMLKSWPGFMFNMMLHQSEMVMFGVGPVYFPNEFTWKFKAAKHGALKLPKGSDATIDTLDICSLGHDFKVHELFNYISTPEKEAAAKKDGWDTALIKKCLMRSCRVEPENGQYNDSQWEGLQQNIKNGDLFYSYGGNAAGNFQHINATDLFVKEYDGQVSHYIVTDDSNDMLFLYQHKNRYESFERFLVLFMTDIGDGSYHSIKGLGARIYPICTVVNRMVNTVVDGTTMASTMIVQGESDGMNINKARIVRLGPITAIERGWNAVTGWNPNLAPVVGVMEKLESVLSQSAGTTRPDITDEPGGSPGSLGVEKLRLMREARLEHCDIDMYYLQLDLLYAEILRRVLSNSWNSNIDGYKERTKFIDNCVKDGVPKELLNIDMLSIQAVRAIGYGSPALAQMNADYNLSLSPYFDEIGKRTVLHDAIAVRSGYRKADELVPLADRNQIPSNDQTIAALENNDFMEGTSSIVGVDQNHIAHLIMHLPPLAKIAEEYNAGAMDRPIDKVYAYMSQAVPHSGSHLDMIAGDPARVNEYKSFMQSFSEIARAYQSIEKEYEAEMQRRQQQQQEQAETIQHAIQNIPDPETQAKLAKIQADMQLGVFKEQNQQKIREAKARHSMSIKERLANQKLAIENTKA